MKIRRIASVLLTIGWLAVLVQPASAGPVLVKGAQSYAPEGDPCFDPGALFSLTMEGGLVGCWWVDTGSDVVHPSGTAITRGTEHFTGCLDLGLDGDCTGDPWGTFWTTFTFTAKFAADGSELHGRCNHPIVSGSEDFEGASGVIEFKDDVTTGIAYYTGIVKLGGTTATSSTRTVSPARTASSTAAAC